MTPDSYKVRAAQLAALWAYGVSQPIFAVLDANPEFLVVRGSSRVEVIAFTLILSLAPPLAALTLEWLLSLVSAHAGDVAHILLIGAFSVPLAARIVEVLSSDVSVAVVTTVALCVVGVASYVRWKAVRLFLAYSIVLPVVGATAFVHGIPLTTDNAEAADVEIPRQVPIVLVVFDEFPVSSLLNRAGEIDAVRYPNFGELARVANWYPNATTVHEHTTSAVPAILTGQLPRQGDLPLLADHPDNVFSLLGASYRFRVHELVTHLCSAQLCQREGASLTQRLPSLFSDVGVVYLHGLLPDSMADHLPSIDQSWGRFLQQGRIQEAENQEQVLDIFRQGLIFPGPSEYEQFVASMNGHSPNATLYAIHLLQPHAPWTFIPSGQQYGFGGAVDGLRDRGRVWERNPWLVTQGLQRHLLQVGYADSLIGRLLGRLKQQRLFNRALVIVAADHGASFMPGGYRRSVDTRNVADIASVPLFVKYPWQRAGHRDARNARTIDILPTIADVVGAPVPWRVDGRSLRRTEPKRPYVIVGRIDGSFLRAKVTTVRRLRARTVQRMTDRFGEGRDSLYRIGQSKFLLGRRIRPGVVDRSDISVRLEKPEWLYVLKESPYLPSRISGWVERGQLSPGTEIAVAVNGRIEALTQPFQLQGRQVFRAMVDPHALREGWNRVDLFAVRGRDHLVWLGSSHAS